MTSISFALWGCARPSAIRALALAELDEFRSHYATRFHDSSLNDTFALLARLRLSSLSSTTSTTTTASASTSLPYPVLFALLANALGRFVVLFAPPSMLLDESIAPAHVRCGAIYGPSRESIHALARANEPLMMQWSAARLSDRTPLCALPFVRFANADFVSQSTRIKSIFPPMLPPLFCASTTRALFV